MNRRGPFWWSLVLGVVLVVLGAGARVADAQCPNDCETNNPCLIGVCVKNECVFRVAQPGTVCRPSAGPCDVQEVCNGSSSLCPSDTRRPAGTVCRAADQPCEEEAECSGSSAVCPDNPPSPSTKVCQAASGPCDLIDRCNGTGRSCPPTFREEGALCRVAAGPCEEDALCTGSGRSCPANPLHGTEVVCRLSDGPCDQPESCTGGSRECPADEFVPAEAGVVCRVPTSSCDAAEICDGSGGQCPGDRTMPDGSSCEADGSDCTADRCEDGECQVGAESDICEEVDAGPDEGPDGGAGGPDAGESGDGGPGDDDGGISDEPADGGGCQVGATGSGGPGWPAVAALLAVLLGWKRRRSSLIGLGVLALVAACSDPADDGAGPDPGVPPATASSVCELSAGCPAGTHCDLGECIQLCSTDDPCADDLVCSPRGRCLAVGAIDQDAPAEADKPAELIAPDPWVLAVPASSNQVSFTLAAVPATAPVRYRVAPGAPWVHVDQPRGEFVGETTVTLSVRRAGLPAGSHAASVVVHTSLGNASLSVTMSNGPTGVYQGVLTYESPARLGSLPLRLEVREQDGQLLANVVADGSPSFARSRPTVFALDARGGGLAGELVQVLGGEDLGPAESLLVSNPAEDPTGADRLGFYFGANRRFGRLDDALPGTKAPSSPPG